MNPTPIDPYTKTTTQIVTSFTVNCRSLDLFNNATFSVDSFDANNNLVSRQVVPITNEQYLAWQNNDEYIIQLMATILGYTLPQPPTPEPSPGP
jgi:hypothetical protein